MSYELTRRWGKSKPNATVGHMQEALDELDVDEHPNASLTHQSGWSLGAFGSGLLVWENVEEGEPRHMKDVRRSTVLRLWLALSGGHSHP